MPKYNFFSRAENGQLVPETMDYIVDKKIGYDLTYTGSAVTQLSNFSLTIAAGKVAQSTNNSKLYFTISNAPDNPQFSIFKDIAKTTLVAQGSRAGDGIITIEEQNSSGVVGTITITNAANNSDSSNTILFGNGSAEAPFKTIFKATTTAAANSKIGLSGGTFNETRAVSKAMKLYGTGLVTYLYKDSNSFQVGDFYNNLIVNGVNYFAYSNNVTYNNCSLTKCALGIHSGSNINTYFKFCQLNDNKIIGVTASSTIYNHFTNCTINNLVSIIGFSGYPSTTKIKTLSRCILTNCVDLKCYSSNFTSFDYNCILDTINWDGTGRDLAWLILNTVWNDNSIDNDPLFNNAAIGDYSLHPDSPCINAGGLAGTTKMHIGAKHEAPISVDAETLFNNATTKINCALSGNAIISAQENLQVSQVGTEYEVFLHSTANDSEEDYYRGLMLSIVSGTGAGSLARIASYNNLTQKVTLESPITTGVDSFYSIGCIIESGNITANKKIIAGVIDIFATFDTNTNYDANDTNNGTTDIYFKWANSELELSSAQYKLMPLATNTLFDNINNAGLGDENYETGNAILDSWFKFKIEMYTTL